MQSIIIISLLLMMFTCAIMENSRNNANTLNQFAKFKADFIAGNIIEYNDLIEQYAIINYETLHLIDTINPESVEQIKTIDYQQNQLANYSQKNFIPFLNYQSLVFNYIGFTTESQELPTLYMTTTWDSFIATVKGISITSMPEIMGKVNQIISKHLYQGNSTYWSVPWLLQQNNCKVIEIYSQVPANSNGTSQLNQVKSLFNQFCEQIQASSSFKFLRYVYMQPIIKTDN